MPVPELPEPSVPGISSGEQGEAGVIRLVLATRNAHKIIELRRILDVEFSAARLSGSGASAGIGAAGGSGPAGGIGAAGGGAGAVRFELVGTEAFPDLADVVETGITFAENALLKAHATAQATGLPAIADDSGLAVDVLGGSPGVFSARWAGRHGDDVANLELVLAQLGDVPDQHRQAHFACAAAFAMPDGTELVRHGTLPGTLIRAPRGTNGFGYDPIFVPDGGTRTSAELTADEKDAISHRGRAFRALAAELPGLL